MYNFLGTDEIEKMEKSSKKLDKSNILKHFTELVCDVIVYHVTDSTNTRARDMLVNGKETPFLLAAEEQTAGRGRHGNSFFSPESGLYYSLVIRPENYESAIAKTTIAAAVSLQEAILETAGIACGIKWVNDLYLNHRKVAGILCEAPRLSSGEPAGIIIGIGINIAQKVFPPELEGKAGSLNCPDLDRNVLAAVLTNRLLYWCDHLESAELIKAYKEASILLGKEVSFVQNGETVTGIAEDINADGNLIVRADQTYVLNSGEISLTSW